MFGLPYAALGAGPTATPTPAAESSFTVLCYHRFITAKDGKKGPSEFHLPVTEFEWQMQYLKDQGITPVSMEQLKAYWFDGKPLPERPVLLTFDDGFESIHEQAYPVVKKFGYPAVLFAYTDFIRWGNPETPPKDAKKKKKNEVSLKLSAIEEMLKNGWTIESHTKSHMNLGKEKDKRAPAAYQKLLAAELNEPLGYIESKFSVRPKCLAYPYGVFNEEVLKQTTESGYTLAFTVDPGPNDKTVPALKLRRDLILYPIKRENFKKLFEQKVLHLGNFTPGDGEVIASSKPLITAEVKDDMDPKGFQLKMGPHMMKVEYDPKTRLLRHQVAAPLKAGGHMLMLEGTDLKGQRRVYNWYFRVKKDAAKAKTDPTAKKPSATSTVEGKK